MDAICQPDDVVPPNNKTENEKQGRKKGERNKMFNLFPQQFHINQTRWPSCSHHYGAYINKQNQGAENLLWDPPNFNFKEQLANISKRS